MIHGVAPEPSGASEFRLSLLTSPGERRDVEYKASVPFIRGEEFSLKLLKQIEGMANGGGGTIVIGFTTDATGLLFPDSSHTDQIAASYEPTELSKQANSVVAKGQQVSVTIYQVRHPRTDKCHPLISVGPFDRTPYVNRSQVSATDTGKLVLEEGAVYLRRAGAETSKVVTPGDWEELITRAVANRRTEFLTEFRALVDTMLPLPLDATRENVSSRRVQQWEAQNRARLFRDEGSDR